MKKNLFKSSEGFGVFFIVLAVLVLFLTTTTDNEIANVYSLLIMFALIFVIPSLYLSNSKKGGSILPSFHRVAPLLIAPTIAHIFNNAIFLSTVVLEIDIIYPLILVAIFVLLFFKIFQDTMKPSILLMSIGAGIGFGFLLTSQAFIGSLGAPVVYALETQVAYSVFLLGVMAAVTEEIIFRGILFPLFYRSSIHEQALGALLFGAGAIIIFMSEFQIIGWVLIAIGIIEFINGASRQIIGKSKIVRFGVAAVASSAIFSGFHVKVAQTTQGDPTNVLIAAFIFGMITCGMVYWMSKGDL